MGPQASPKRFAVKICAGADSGSRWPGCGMRHSVLRGGLEDERSPASGAYPDAQGRRMAQAGDPDHPDRKRVPGVKMRYDARSKYHGCNETGGRCGCVCMLAGRRSTNFGGGENAYPRWDGGSWWGFPDRLQRFFASIGPAQTFDNNARLVGRNPGQSDRDDWNQAAMICGAPRHAGGAARAQGKVDAVCSRSQHAREKDTWQVLNGKRPASRT